MVYLYADGCVYVIDASLIYDPFPDGEEEEVSDGMAQEE